MDTGVWAAIKRAVALRYTLGIVLILLVAVIWVAAGELIQVIFDNNNFHKPFFLTYFNTCIFSTWLLGFLFKREWREIFLECWRRRRHPPDAEKVRLNLATHSSAKSTPPPSPSNPSPTPSERPTLEAVVKLSATFCLIWLGANYTYNLSLGFTSVASSTILSTTSSLWTFLVGWLFLKDKFDVIKLLAASATFGGATLVALMDSDDSDTSETNKKYKHKVLGDLLALLGAILYACYVCLLQKKIPNEEKFPMPMFFGFVGLINLCTLWPVLVFLHLTGWETFEWPDTPTFGYLFLNGFVGTNLSDVLWAKSVLLTSPLVATIGLSLTIPIAMVSDSVIKKKKYTAAYVVGALLVILGFLLINTTNFVRKRLTKLCRFACPGLPLPAFMSDTDFDSKNAGVDGDEELVTSSSSSSASTVQQTGGNNARPVNWQEATLDQLTL